MKNLPSELYSVKSVQQIEQLCIHQYHVPGYTLMRRAGQAVVNLMNNKSTRAQSLLVLCGAGNNAGDGYVIARLAKQSGYSVKLVTLVEVSRLTGDALLACKHWHECGEIELFNIEAIESDDVYTSYLAQADIVVDALLGTGLMRELQGVWKTAVNRLNEWRENNHCQTVISVDVPSGLNAETGALAGTAVRADYTVTFIGLKPGLFTGAGRAYAGSVLFDDLDVPDEALLKCPSDATLLNALTIPFLPSRSPDAHKGLFGHVLIVGGNVSMAGAVILAARSALRSGAGLVTVFTHASNVSTVTVACPEVMVVSSLQSVGTDAASSKTSCLDIDAISESLLSRVTHIAIGPGLGQDAWAKACLQQCLQANKPLVIDADGLNLLARKAVKITTECVLTPHPGEAARLLSTDTANIGENRFSAIKSIYQKYAARNNMAVVLKGAGSLVYDGQDTAVCPWGNSAMATAGMGDVLTGVVVAFMAQNLPPAQAAEYAVCVHGLAGDEAAQGMTRGMLASDVIEKLPLFI